MSESNLVLSIGKVQQLRSIAWCPLKTQLRTYAFSGSCQGGPTTLPGRAEMRSFSSISDLKSFFSSRDCLKLPSNNFAKQLSRLQHFRAKSQLLSNFGCAWVRNDGHPSINSVQSWTVAMIIKALRDPEKNQFGNQISVFCNTNCPKTWVSTYY